ncbi:MAG: ferritin-like domain-containing protein [Pseudomonadota bacterium]
MTKPAPRGAQNPKTFYDGLIAELTARRAAIAPARQSFGPPRPLSRAELIEWLKFQAWYELEATGFIGSWLDDVKEPEAFQGLARQVADEARHYRLFLRHLESFGGSLAGWVPEPEWVAWVSEFYRAGNDTLERVSAHNITGELGAMQAFETLLPRVPDATKRLLRKVMPDERFHVALGRTVVQRYATSADAQARVRRRVLRAFELEQAGRTAYERRMAALR